MALVRDIRFAFRLSAKHPGFTVAVVLCLGLGIGINAASFSVVYAVLMRPLPFQEPERLVMVWGALRSSEVEKLPASVAEVEDYRQQASTLESVAALHPAYLNWTGGSEPERLSAAQVSASLLPMLGVEPQLGRGIAPEEDRLGGPHVAVLTYGLWQRRFGSEKSAVGRKMILNGEPYTIVGVLPRLFKLKLGARDVEIIVPAALDVENAPPRAIRGLRVMARLKPSVSLESAQAEMDVIAHRFEAKYPDVYPAGSGWDIQLFPLQEELVGKVKPALLVLFGAVGLVLLIACANVANLLLARATMREREVSLRAALGASRSQLVRQMLTEGLVLGVAGGAVGLFLAAWSLWILTGINPPEIPRLDEVSLHPAVLVFTVLISLASGLLASLAPAFFGWRSNLRGTLQESSTGTASGIQAGLLRSALIAGEVALALVVLAWAGLIISSFLRLQEVDPGFQPSRLLSVQLYMSPTKYAEDPQQAAFAERLVERLRALPGVTSAGAVSVLPLGDLRMTAELAFEGRQAFPGEPIAAGDWRAATPGYFETMGIPLVAGRLFSAADNAHAPAVTIVDEKLARRYWPNQSPLGKRLSLSGLTPDEKWLTVVGVVGNVKSYGLDQDTREQLYTPFAQTSLPFLSIVVRTKNTDPTALSSEARKAVWSVDRDQPLAAIKPVTEILAGSTAGRRAYSFLMGLFGATALVLAMVGIYSVVSYSVTRRAFEIGVRVALGARQEHVYQTVLGRALIPVLAGTVTGIACVLVTSRFIQSLLFDVSPTDLPTIVGVSGLLFAVALVASLLPARRAVGINPALVLKRE